MNPPVKQRRIRFLVYVSLLYTLTSLGMTWGAWELYQNVQNPNTTLTPPASGIKASDDNIVLVMATALQPHSPEQYNVKIHWAENDNFRSHLRNIGAQRGWFTHESHSDTVRMVVPATELGQVADIQADPVKWVQQNANPSSPAVGPSSLDLRNVVIHIHSLNDILYLQIITASALFILPLVGACALITAAVALLKPNSPIATGRRF